MRRAQSSCPNICFIGPWCAIQWAGPVLASDRLLLANSEGEVWSISPYTGDALGRVDLPAPIQISPSVAKETVLVLTEDADLVALR